MSNKTHIRISKKQCCDLPIRTEKELSSGGVQSVQGDVEDTEFFNPVYFVNLVRPGFIVNIDWFLEMILDPYDTTDRDGMGAKDVGDFCKDAAVFLTQL